MCSSDLPAQAGRGSGGGYGPYFGSVPDFRDDIKGVLFSDVVNNSPAAKAGLKAGDEVVAYDGKRVFDLRDLNARTFEGTAGESVAVTVRRDGQTVHLTLPRGPIGITGGGPPGFRGR